MMFEDRFSVAAPQPQVWRALTDPAVVGPCIPGCTGIEVLSPTLFKALVGVGVGPVKASFSLEVEILEQAPPVEVRTKTRGGEGSMASTLSADSLIRLEAVSAQETAVYYQSEVAIVGRLGKFGLGVMKKKAESLGSRFAEAFRARVEAQEAAE